MFVGLGNKIYDTLIDFNFSKSRRFRLCFGLLFKTNGRMASIISQPFKNSRMHTLFTKNFTKKSKDPQLFPTPISSMFHARGTCLQGVEKLTQKKYFSVGIQKFSFYKPTTQHIAISEVYSYKNEIF